MEEFTLTEGQQEAVDLLLKFKEDENAKVFILKGFAGTGKSYLTSNYILKMFPKISLTATTHKACEAINKNLGYEEAITIHSRLKLKLKKEDHKQVLKRSDRDTEELDFSGVTLIDECSLINDELLKYILEIDKVIFVGDPAQLEKIEDDSDSSEISKCFDLDTEYKIELTEITRQAKENPIISLSMDIRESNDRFDLNKIMSSDKIYKVSVSDEDIAKSCANAINAFKDSRVICYHNYRVIRMNNLIHKHLYGETLFPFSVGEKVMFNEMYELKITKNKKENIEFRNNQECTVMNIIHSPDDADVILVALKTEKGKIIDNVPVNLKPHLIEKEVKSLFNKWFKDRDRNALNEAWALKEKYAPLRHCYAITCFKSQGSSYDVAYVDLRDLDALKASFSFNRALYVATTRPKDTLIFNY